MLDSIKAYVGDRNFNCGWEYNLEPIKAIKLKDPIYKFNLAEKLGNAFLTPIDKVFINYSKTDKCYVKAALIVAGIFATIVGLIGATIKRLGECANSNVALRKQALIKFSEIKIKTKAQDGDQLKNECNTLLDKCQISLSGILNSLEQSQIDKLFAAIARITKKLATFEDLTPERIEIAQITQKDEASQKTTLDYVDKLNTICTQYREAKNVCIAYNEILQKMILNTVRLQVNAPPVNT